MKKPSFFVTTVVVFLILYSYYVFSFRLNVENYSDIIVAVTFFFTLFSGFFITRQNDRYTEIADEISNNDGLFSLFYRVSSVAPAVQIEVRGAIRDHYTKILESSDWAYHIKHPSNTITRIFKAYSTASDDDKEKLGQFSDGFGGAFASIQVSRKRMVMLHHEKLLPIHWAITLILGTLMIVSFNFIPAHSLVVDILKIFFGLSIVLVILLLKQLDDLTIFGKDFNKKTAEDIFRIIDEKDMAELEKKIIN